MDLIKMLENRNLKIHRGSTGLQLTVLSGPTFQLYLVKKGRKLCFFVVVDGGLTRVEFAAELHDFLHEDLAKLYDTLKSCVKITLLEAADHILGMIVLNFLRA